jgi:hypothetical protein
MRNQTLAIESASFLIGHFHSKDLVSRSADLAIESNAVGLLNLLFAAVVFGESQPSSSLHLPVSPSILTNFSLTSDSLAGKNNAKGTDH